MDETKISTKQRCTTKPLERIAIVIIIVSPANAGKLYWRAKKIVIFLEQYKQILKDGAI